MDDKKVIEMKQDIRQCMRKKDYYDILGIQKTATEAEVKKAYKRLALKFHPDKNCVEGAKEAFKKVSNAYATLVNAEKRQQYNRYGPEEIQQQQFRQNNRRQQEFDPNQIFREFFGQRPRNGQHYYTFNMGGGGRGNHHQQGQGFNFSYLIIILAIIYFIAPFFHQKPLYSFSFSSQYNYRVNTAILKVPYFVRQNFRNQANADKNFKRSVDETVDMNFLKNLSRSCEEAMNLKRKFQYQAYMYGSGAKQQHYLRQARQVDQKSCHELHQIRQKHTHYVERLFYYH